jgi:hypothetical protein
VSADLLAGLGAFLSGMGSILSAALYIRAARKRYEADCRKRIEALEEGIRLERERT